MVESVRCGCGKERLLVGGGPRVGILDSVASGRSVLILLRGGSGGPPNPNCWARIEPRSSIGVKMLRDLEDRCFGSGGLEVSVFRFD